MRNISKERFVATNVRFKAPDGVVIVFDGAPRGLG